MRKTKKRLTRREYRVLKTLIDDAAKPIQDRVSKSSGSLNFFSTTVEDESRDRSLVPSILHTCQQWTNAVHVHTYVTMNNVEWIRVQERGGELQAGFFTEQDLENFLSWHEEYMKKFGSGHTKLDYPPPTDGVYPYIISRYQDSSGKRKLQVADSVHDRWVWCLENLENEVRYFSENFFFSCPEDAALYTLTFCS